jgi:hypothetical protein
MGKYRIRDKCQLWHEDKNYREGDTIELDEELALHHAPNIEVVKAEKPKADKPDAERKS